jgi:hypothetical protein
MTSFSRRIASTCFAKTNCFVLTILFATISVPHVQADIFLTGSQLVGNPLVTFPNGAPAVTGNSVLFGSPGPDFAKLFQVSLGIFGYSDAIDVKIDITRKTVDFDPKFVLTDGTRMYGAWVADDNGGYLDPVRYQDAGIRGVYDGRDSGFLNAGYPNVDSSFIINLRFSFSQTSSTLTAGFLGSTTTFSTSSQYINPTSGLSFAMVRDNETSEQYQINSLQITTVPEPSSALMVGFVFGMAGFLLLTKPVSKIAGKMQ